MAKKRICEICKKRPATVPDRNRMGAPINRICGECHAARLRGDLKHILDEQQKRAALGRPT